MPKWSTEGAACLGLWDCWKRNKIPNGLGENSFPAVETVLLFPSRFNNEKEGATDF